MFKKILRNKDITPENESHTLISMKQHYAKFEEVASPCFVAVVLQTLDMLPILHNLELKVHYMF